MSVGHDEYWSGDQRGQCRSGPRRRGESGLLQRQRGVLEDPLGAQLRRHEHARTARWSSYKDTHFNAPDRSRLDVDRHLARPAVRHRRATAATLRMP